MIILYIRLSIRLIGNQEIKMAKIQVCHTLESNVVDRVEELKRGDESRSSVLRRLIDVGLPILEKEKREMPKVGQ